MEFSSVWSNKCPRILAFYPQIFKKKFQFFFAISSCGRIPVASHCETYSLIHRTIYGIFRWRCIGWTKVLFIITVSCNSGKWKVVSLSSIFLVTLKICSKIREEISTRFTLLCEITITIWVLVWCCEILHQFLALFIHSN